MTILGCGNTLLEVPAPPARNHRVIDLQRLPFKLFSLSRGDCRSEGSRLALADGGPAVPVHLPQSDLRCSVALDVDHPG